MPLKSLEFSSLANKDIMVIGEAINSEEKNDLLLERYISKACLVKRAIQNDHAGLFNKEGEISMALRLQPDLV